MAHDIEVPEPTGKPWHGRVIRADNGAVLGTIPEIAGKIMTEVEAGNLAADDAPSMGLMIRLMERNADDLAAVTNRVMADKDEEIARLKAELAFIRAQVSYLCNQKWAPNPMRILSVLHPDADQIEMYREDDQ